MSDNGWMKIKRSTAVDIADALREKKGSADLIDPADFPAVIRGMSGKLPSVIDKTVTELTFEDFGNATKIGYIVFRECKNLTRVEIPKGITSIEGNAFMSCSKLAEVIFEEGSTLASIASQAFSGAQMTSLILPCSVTSMNGALYSCSKLASVSLPLACGSWNSIFGDFFASYSSSSKNSGVPSSLKTVTITNANSVPEDCFNACTSVKKIVFDSGCSFTTIGGDAFYGCTSLSEIVLPASLTEFPTLGVFGNCSALGKIVIYAPEPPTLPMMGLYGVPDTCEFYVLPDSVAKYKAATNWAERGDYIFQLEEGV